MPVPNRQELMQQEQEQASFYLRDFDPKRYTGYYKRIYDPTAYFEQIGINKFCELIEHGNSLLNIAEKLDVSGNTLRRWVRSKKEYTTLVAEAYTYAGEMFAYKAEQALRTAPNDKIEMVRAGKLAEHYRWMASRLNKEMFGESKESKDTLRPPTVVNLNFAGAVVPQVLEKTVNRVVPDFMQLTEQEE